MTGGKEWSYKMKSKDAFGNCHPAVNFTYFGLVIGFSMFLMHPVCLLLSLFCAVCYYARLRGRRTLRFLVRYALPLMLLTAVINPAFNHRGMVILCYLPTGNPLTLESIIYGLAAAVMLVSVLIWFGCCTEIMTSDKFVYLFGRIIPALSLVLSMTLRFIPRFKEQLERIKEAQRGMRKYNDNGSPLGKLKSALTCFSAMVTWALESSIETADSMKSRGYGLRGRTAFSIYTFTERDKYLLIWLGLDSFFLMSGSISENLYWQYFPSIRGMLAEPLTIGLEAAYFGLCITPTAIDIWEEKQWKYLRSKI